MPSIVLRAQISTCETDGGMYRFIDDACKDFFRRDADTPPAGSRPGV